MTDTVKVLQQTGETIENVKASVQKNKIFVMRSDFLVQSGDLIQRTMSNGGEETYKVIDPGFHEGLHTIPAGYQMDVVKLGIPEAQSAIQHITYNISGTNNRVTQNSVDNSVNVINVNPDLQNHLNELRGEIDKLSLSTDEKSNSHEIIDSIEEHLNSQTPKKSVIHALISSLPHAEKIVSIGSGIAALLK